MSAISILVGKSMDYLPVQNMKAPAAIFIKRFGKTKISSEKQESKIRNKISSYFTDKGFEVILRLVV